MTWVKLDTIRLGDPRLLEVSPRAHLAYLAAMCWCADHRTDGHIPRASLVAAVSASRPKRVPDVARELSGVGLWEETSTGWYIPDYPKWGPMADNTDYQAERNREKQQRFKAKGQGNRVTNRVTNGEVTGLLTGLVTGLEKEKEKEKEIPPVVPHGGTPQKPPRKTQIPEDFEPDSNQRRWAAEERPGVDLRAEVPKFVDYHRSKGNTFVDHQRAFRTWLRNTRSAAGANGSTFDLQEQARRLRGTPA